MAYTKNNWQTGDTVTAEKLNHMESGIENANEPFIVTLTPTAQDFSGTMDKTVAEINAAYEAGRKIQFKVLAGASQFMCVDCTAQYFHLPKNYPSFNVFIVNGSNDVLIFAYTGATDDGTQQTYFTRVYPLTPMS